MKMPKVSNGFKVFMVWVVIIAAMIVVKVFLVK